MADKKPILESILKHGLSGRCFMIRDERGMFRYQGVVHDLITTTDGSFALVQYETGWGELNNMALWPISRLIEPEYSGGPPTGCILFEDDAHLRDYIATVQRPRDEAIRKRMLEIDAMERDQ